MPLKKLSSHNLIHDEGYSEESDSSLESNSRRNARRKKPQRKISSKENRIDSLHQSKDKVIEKVQEISSEKNRKRPPIVKIFRRIDRKAKNYYLVDDKMDATNQLVTSPKPKSCLDIPNRNQNISPSFSPFNEKSFKSNCTEQKSNIFREYSIRKVETDGRELNDLREVNAFKHLSDIDSLYSSPTDIDQMYDESDFWKMPSDIDSSNCLVTNIYQVPNKPDAWKAHHAIGDVYSSMIDINQTHSESDLCSLFLSSSSDIPNSCETVDRQTSTGIDVCIQESSNIFNVTETGIDEIHSASNSSEILGGQSSTAATSRSDVCNLLLSSYSDIPNACETFGRQTSTGNVCFQQASNNFNATETGRVRIPSESDSSEMYDAQSSTTTADKFGICSLLLSNYSDISSSSETDDEPTSTGIDVCIQQSNNTLDATDIDNDEIPNESESSEMYDGEPIIFCS